MRGPRLGETFGLCKTVGVEVSTVPRLFVRGDVRRYSSCSSFWDQITESVRERERERRVREKERERDRKKERERKRSREKEKKRKRGRERERERVAS